MKSFELMTATVIVVVTFGAGLAEASWPVTQLTDNSYDDFYPQVSGSNVVWHGFGGSGGTGEVFLYNGSDTTQLTNNSYDDLYPQVSGSTIAWYGWDGSDWEIFTAVPEPSTLSLLLLGGFFVTRRKWWRGNQ